MGAMVILVSVIMITTAILVGKLFKAIGKIENINDDVKKYIHEQKESRKEKGQ